MRRSIYCSLRERTFFQSSSRSVLSCIAVTHADCSEGPHPPIGAAQVDCSNQQPMAGLRCSAFVHLSWFFLFTLGFQACLLQPPLQPFAFINPAYPRRCFNRANTFGFEMASQGTRRPTITFGKLAKRFRTRLELSNSVIRHSINKLPRFRVANVFRSKQPLGNQIVDRWIFLETKDTPRRWTSRGKLTEELKFAQAVVFECVMTF